MTYQTKVNYIGDPTINRSKKLGTPANRSTERGVSAYQPLDRGQLVYNLVFQALRSQKSYVYRFVH